MQPIYIYLKMYEVYPRKHLIQKRKRAPILKVLKIQFVSRNDPYWKSICTAHKLYSERQTDNLTKCQYRYKLQNLYDYL